MTELKNVEQELSRFNTRLLAAAAFVLFGFGLLGARLVHLQIVKHEELATQAENNRIAVVPIVPNRGLIVDRNGVVLANNYSAYTLEITPSKAGELEPLIDRLAEVVDIQTRDRKRLKRLLEESKSFLHRVYGGSLSKMVLGFVESGSLSQKELEELKALIGQQEQDHDPH